jgi:SAM-dependent methyltransferase
MPGFSREKLRERYDVGDFEEDEWHRLCGERTNSIIRHELGTPGRRSNHLLNAGCGVYSLGLPYWREIGVDLFEAPLGSRPDVVCANIESLPFDNGSFGAILCVGEVLGYCDPHRALQEFSRLAAPGATLICDFGSTLSARYLLTGVRGRMADIIVDEYNGTEERVWVYHPKYIRRLILEAGFEVLREFGTHSLPALARRMGCPQSIAASAMASFQWLPQPKHLADVHTIVAAKRGA